MTGVHLDDWFIEAEGWYSSGEVTLHVAAEDGHPGWESTSDNRVFDANLVAGKRLRTDWGPTFTPFFGCGVRDLSNDILVSPTVEFSNGYLKERRYWYMPVGTKIELAKNNSFYLATDMRFMLLLHGTESAHLSDIDPDLQDTASTLGFGDGYGIFASLNLN